MKAVVQRARSASLAVEARTIHQFNGACLVAFVGIEQSDASHDAQWLAEKIPNLRIFPDDAGKMNRSVLDVDGSILLIPNFTLAGNAHHGRRPSFDTAMPPDPARAFFDKFCDLIVPVCPRTGRGIFGANMQILVENDGPITLLLDSHVRRHASDPTSA